MKKIVLQLILIIILAVNHDSEFQVFAELEDIPEWVKQEVYAIYKVEASGLEGPVTSKYTVIMVNSTDIIFNIEQTYLGETSETVLPYPNTTIFVTQTQIQSVISGNTELDILGDLSFSYVGEETITIPGTFECHRFNLTYDMGHIDLWVDKNTGLIVRDFGEHMNGMTTSSMLQESNLIPPQPEGIPGFPIPSIITGLFVIVFLMTLMNSRERAHA